MKQTKKDDSWLTPELKLWIAQGDQRYNDSEIERLTKELEERMRLRDKIMERIVALVTKK